MFFDDLDIFGQLEERLEQLGLGGGIGEFRQERVEGCDVGCDLEGVIADGMNGSGSVHAWDYGALRGFGQRRVD